MDSETLAGVKKIELEILLEVDALCRRNGIDYFLDCGTVLGAARHGGFIPWDDDIDIGMPRQHYERFLRLAQKELPDVYFLQTKETDPETKTRFAKVRKNGTLMVESAFEKTSSHKGIWIDIFPFDPIDEDKRNVIRRERSCRMWRRLTNLRSIDTTSSGSSLIKSILRKIVRAPLLLLPVSFFEGRMRALREGDEFAPGKVLVCFEYFSSFPRLSYDDVYPLATLPFEGHEFPVVRNWEKYLSETYGDWRKLPPEGSRVVHDVLEVDLGESCGA